MYEFIKLNDEEDVEVEDLSIEYEDRTASHQGDDYTYNQSDIISDEKMKEAIFLNDEIFTFKNSDLFYSKNEFKENENGEKEYKVIIRCGAWGSGEIYIGTNKNYRNKGYASLAVKYVVENKSGKYARIFSGNKPSINLFKSLGFKIYAYKEDVKTMDLYNGRGIVLAILPQFVKEILKSYEKKYIEYTDKVFKPFDTEENEKGKYYEYNDLIYTGQRLTKEDKFYAQSVVISKVKQISSNLFKEDFPFLKKIVIKEGSLTSIPDEIFPNKKYLQEVIIESNITSIGEDAFRSCHNLVSVKLPDSVIEIKNNAFAYCNNLKNINIPSSIKHIEEYAFAYCDSLGKIIIPSGVSIKKGAFLMENDFEITLPEGTSFSKFIFGRVDSSTKKNKELENITINTNSMEIKKFATKYGIKCNYQGKSVNKKPTKYEFKKVEQEN